jgi:hypothetical protein
MSEADDLELIKQRKIEDMRVFLTNALIDENAPRLAPALRAMRGLLLDGQWHAWTAVIATMLRASDIAVKSCESQIYNAVKAGVIERQGDYRAGRGRTPAVDSRLIRLVDWPDSL